MDVMVIESGGESPEQQFDRVVGSVERQVRRALVARYGVDIGVETTADAVAWAWEHLDELDEMKNPAGYMFRVGQTAARRLRRLNRRDLVFPREPAHADFVPLDSDLFDALRRVSADQRVALVLVHGYGFSYSEAAEVLDTSVAAVTNHIHRGLRRVRRILEPDNAKR
jgi:DNA-directed RNA polymerase specialized sigma24 family protein